VRVSGSRLPLGAFKKSPGLGRRRRRRRRRKAVKAAAAWGARVSGKRGAFPAVVRCKCGRPVEARPGFGGRPTRPRSRPGPRPGGGGQRTW
jgi:hypothetical protein